MGVSVEGGKGRGKGMMVDLNLVPFIDFMSCLIAFLMIAAVWTQIASLDVEQNVSNEPPPIEEVPPEPPVPPLTIHVKADGHWIGRKVEEGLQVPKSGEAYDYTKLEELLVKDHETFPAEEMVIINTDDGVAYEEMILVLDLSRKIGYPKTLLAGGPPSAALPAEGAAPMPGGG
ncbi:MAG: biopolymer transporter ExbD [Pseudomonadota bacterium]|nr:biopolymer transporter ExbD [Pseudomonadota bacterium]